MYLINLVVDNLFYVIISHTKFTRFRQSLEQPDKEDVSDSSLDCKLLHNTRRQT